MTATQIFQNYSKLGRCCGLGITVRYVSISESHLIMRGGEMMIDKIRKVMRGEKGFTLVEMMVVLIIIAVLIALGIRAYIGYIGSAKMTKANGDITTIQAALDSYYAQNQSYPAADWNALATAGISSYEVSPATAYANNSPYLYANSTTSAYSVYTVTSVNGNYMRGIGSSGISQQTVPTSVVP
jgi:type II secretion system protein G